jgi:D-alanyl-D-alanine carboxypeptidase
MTRSLAPFAAAALGLAASAATASAQMPVLVVDAHSGQVLVSEDATRPWNPASTTKMMTAYVALRAVREGRARMDTPLVASARAAAQKPSKIGIRPGQEITLENALKVLMVKSANDVAVVVAEAIGGSIEGFSRLMNAEAQRLGMTQSRFYNPHGFHAEGHQTSARDLAVLTRAMLFDFPEHQDLWGIGAVQLNGRTMNNTNGLIGRYAGAAGMKTGFVCASGFNLVSTASRGGRTLIAVVLGASSGGERVVRSAQLLDQAFGMWGNGTGQTLSTLPASGYSSAPNMRSQICTGRRRGVVLADDADYGGALLAGSGAADTMGGGSPLAFFSQSPTQPVARSHGVSMSGGRAILGPRVGVVPQQIYLGRAPGSTALAMGPGARNIPAAAAAAAAVPGLPASATAIAPSQLRTAAPADETRPAQQAGIRSGAQAPSASASAPLQLPGVITNGPRPGAQAAIRPRQAAPAADRGAPKAQQPQKKKQQAAQAGRKVEPKAQAKAQPQKKQPQQPASRPKPANDD